MRLELGTFPVGRIHLGGESTWADGDLTVDAAALTELVRQDGAVRDATLGVAAPGSQQRLVNVLDALEPRVKVEGPGVTFPGIHGPTQAVGSGRTHVLGGMTVMTAAELPWPPGGGLRAPRAGIIDMSGPAADLSPFSATHNLVISLELEPGYENSEYDEAVRRAGVVAARFLAETVRGLEPPELEVRELAPTSGDLPRVLYIDQVQSQGTFAHTLLYGQVMDTLVPTLIHPNELTDGAVVSSNYLYPCFKVPTALRSAMPVTEELYARHGQDHDFLGVILARGHYYSYEEKMRVAEYAAKLAGMLHADGAVLSWEGGGNSIVEALLTVQALERAGIPTVTVAYELGGADGRDAPMIQSVPEARALVSSGSYEKRMALPRMDGVLGGESLRLLPEVGGERFPAGDELDLQPRHELYCAANQSGAARLRTVAF